MLVFIYQFTGVTAVLAFANYFFKVGLPDSSALPQTLSTIIAVLNNLFTLLSLNLNHKYGRKMILQIGLIGLMILWALYAFIGYIDSPANMIAKICIVAFPTLFAWSSGGITFLYVSETLPEIGLAITTFFGSLFGFITAQSFLDVVDAINFTGAALIFSGCSLVGLIYITIYMKESKDKTKAEILAEYRKGERSAYIDES